MIFLRSLIFNVLFYLVLVVLCIVALPALLLPRGALMALEAVRPKNGKERIHDTSFICKLVGLQDDEAQSLTGCIKSLLPGTIWTAPSHSSEEFDGLF